jgi:hypothetical protein
MLKILNALARVFGVLALLGGGIFLVSAYAIQANRLTNIVLGIFLIAMGVAFLWVKPIQKEDLSRLLGGRF